VTGQPPAVGTAYFPEPDIAPNGTGHGIGHGSAPGRLPGLPRRRRPAMIALAIAMAGAGVLVSAAVYQNADHQVAVVTVTQPVPAGAVITAADLGTTSVTVGTGIRVIPAAQLGQVTGEIAAVALRPATLLAPADLTTAQPPGPGQVLVPASVKPSALPASGLFPGDRVLIVATPGDQGQTGSSAGSPSLTAPVPGVVEAVSDAPDADGLDVVDLLVSGTAGTAVAEQVSTGQFALIITKRGS
jgi:SAF domain